MLDLSIMKDKQEMCSFFFRSASKVTFVLGESVLVTEYHLSQSQSWEWRYRYLFIV